MPNKIAKITNNTKDAIKRKSAYSLPDRPSDQGMKSEDIKRAFWQPVVDVTYSALAEIDRIIDEINGIFSCSYDAHIANQSNPHSVSKSQVGLGSCDNTADADKPLSTPQREVLNTHNYDTVAHADIRKSIANGLALKVPITDIQDAFTSTAADKPLSAYRGKILYDSLQTTDGKTELAVKSISLNSSNGILTITKTNGTTSTIDLPLEYMVKSGYYDSIKKNIVLELAGGTTIEIPAAALVNEYYGDNSTITLYNDTADGNKLKFKVADTYKAAVASEIANETTNRQEEIARVERSIVTKQGTTVTVGGIAQNAIAFTDDPQAQIDNKADGIFFNNGGELKTITIPNSLSNTFCFRQIGIVTLKDAADTVLLTISAKSFFIQRRTDVAVVVEFNENNVKTTHLTNINQLYLELKATYGFVQIMENQRS